VKDGGLAVDGSAQAIKFHFGNDECSTKAGLDKHRIFRRFRAAQITDIGGVFVLLISMWTGTVFFIFVTLLPEPCLQKKRTVCELLFSKDSAGILCVLFFSYLHLVCGGFFPATFRFTLERPWRCLLASSRRKSAGKPGL